MMSKSKIVMMTFKSIEDGDTHGVEFLESNATSWCGIDSGPGVTGNEVMALAYRKVTCPDCESKLRKYFAGC
jgi:hypothetical protein